MHEYSIVQSLLDSCEENIKVRGYVLDAVGA
ncbi:MAG: hypothetical protein QG560_109 [Campylobacterota bacterium]|nr:hypothetical protein [Campylobacterota bacterium]